MTKAKHTPGPWTYNGYADHCEVGRDYHEIVDQDGYEIANQNGLIVTRMEARLVAEAPAMAALLQEIADFNPGDAVGQHAAAILARIEGEEEP